MFFKEGIRERERGRAEEGERGTSFPFVSIFKTDYPCDL
jgi:hypothetical protein